MNIILIACSLVVRRSLRTLPSSFHRQQDAEIFQIKPVFFIECMCMYVVKKKEPTGDRFDKKYYVNWHVYKKCWTVSFGNDYSFSNCTIKLQKFEILT